MPTSQIINRVGPASTGSLRRLLSRIGRVRLVTCAFIPHWEWLLPLGEWLGKAGKAPGMPPATAGFISLTGIVASVFALGYIGGVASGRKHWGAGFAGDAGQDEERDKGQGR